MNKNMNNNNDNLIYYNEKNDLKRFQHYIDNFEYWGKKDECCIWLGNKSNGYGYFNTSRKNNKEKKRKKLLAHRLAYYLFYNDMPFICRHKCRNKCVNPLHLENGDYKDNAHDKIRDGTISRLFGNQNHMFGKTHTKEAKEKIKKNNYMRGKKSTMFGKKHTNESKKKMSEKAKLRKPRTNTYEVTSPNKKNFITSNLTEFCNIHKLRYKTMLEVSTGRVKSHRGGWICKKIKN